MSLCWFHPGVVMTTMKLKLIETGIYQIITILEVNSGWSNDRSGHDWWTEPTNYQTPLMFAGLGVG